MTWGGKKNWKRGQNQNVEQVIKRQICDYLTRLGWVVYMYPSFRGFTRGDGTRVNTNSTYMPNGVPDLLACEKGTGAYWGIEVKRPSASQKAMPFGKTHAKGVLSDHQKRELNRIADAGGVALVAYGVEDVIAAVKAQDMTRRRRTHLTIRRALRTLLGRWLKRYQVKVWRRNRTEPEISRPNHSGGEA